MNTTKHCIQRISKKGKVHGGVHLTEDFQETVCGQKLSEHVTMVIRNMPTCYHCMTMARAVPKKVLR